MNNSIWPIDGTLTGTATPGQNRFESNDNEELHISQTPELEPYPSEFLVAFWSQLNWLLIYKNIETGKIWIYVLFYLGETYLNTPAVQ